MCIVQQAAHMAGVSDIYLVKLARDSLTTSSAGRGGVGNAIAGRALAFEIAPQVQCRLGHRLAAQSRERTLTLLCLPCLSFPPGT